jgi:hypothetical protein
MNRSSVRFRQAAPTDVPGILYESALGCRWFALLIAVIAFDLNSAELANRVGHYLCSRVTSEKTPVLLRMRPEVEPRPQVQTWPSVLARPASVEPGTANTHLVELRQEAGHALAAATLLA